MKFAKNVSANNIGNSIKGKRKILKEKSYCFSSAEYVIPSSMRE